MKRVVDESSSSTSWSSSSPSSSTSTSSSLSSSSSSPGYMTPANNLRQDHKLFNRTENNQGNMTFLKLATEGSPTDYIIH
eukprot:9187023-Pyramimonas_sp.AAC.1